MYFLHNIQYIHDECYLYEVLCMHYHNVAAYSIHVYLFLLKCCVKMSDLAFTIFSDLLCLMCNILQIS